jgi:hypothetical protein
MGSDEPKRPEIVKRKLLLIRTLIHLYTGIVFFIHFLYKFSILFLIFFYTIFNTSGLARMVIN